VGDIFHVTARGNRRQEIFRDDSDRGRLIALLDAASERSKWRLHAYCLMPNHYHLVIELVEPTLSDGFQWLNGTYAQAFNRRHGFTGHLFQGRFHSEPVQSDGHLLELSRYLAHNPVRARLCAEPADWRWSSYRATAGITPPVRFLAVGRVLAYFGYEPEVARGRFQSFVNDGASAVDPAMSKRAPSRGQTPGRGSSRRRRRPGSGRPGG
jgi:REP element-mobilizing transposase RayT